MNKTTYGRNGNQNKESASDAIMAETRWANERFVNRVDVWETKISSSGQPVQVFVKSIKLGR